MAGTLIVLPTKSCWPGNVLLGQGDENNWAAAKNRGDLPQGLTLGAGDNQFVCAGDAELRRSVQHRSQLIDRGRHPG